MKFLTGATMAAFLLILNSGSAQAAEREAVGELMVTHLLYTCTNQSDLENAPIISIRADKYGRLFLHQKISLNHSTDLWLKLHSTSSSETVYTANRIRLTVDQTTSGAMAELVLDGEIDYACSAVL